MHLNVILKARLIKIIIKKLDSPAKHKMWEEGDIILASLLCRVTQLGQHVGISCRAGEQQQSAEILRLMQALKREPELTLLDGKLC